MHSEFAMIAKIRYDSENSVIAKIENFAMHSKFRYDCKNFAITAKFSLSLIVTPLCCFLLPPACISHILWLLFLNPRPDEID